MAHPSELSQFRLRGDPEADLYLERLAAGDSGTDRQAWFEGAVNDLRRPDAPMPAWVTEWENRPCAAPGWYEGDLLADGQEIFKDWLLEITTVLFFASLPNDYAAKDGAKVLFKVSQLADPGTAGERIGTTGDMLLRVTEPGGFGPGGTAIARLRRVRLLHAAVRGSLSSRTGSEAWSSAQYGVPVNQEDLLGTLLSFTVTVFDGLERAGIFLSDADKTAYLHLWAVIGHYLGIEQAARILDVHEAEKLDRDLSKKLQRRTPEGIELTQVLIADLRTRLPRPMRSLPDALVRHLAGKHIADIMRIRRAPAWEPMLALKAAIDGAIFKLPGGPAVLSMPSRLIGRHLISASVARNSGAPYTEAATAHSHLEQNRDARP
jgi:hypothetical protein